MERTWKKPEVSKTSQELTGLSECTETEMNDVNGGFVIGVCLYKGLGGNMTTLDSGIVKGYCYAIGF